MEENIAQKKIRSIDVARGIAIILVVIGHTITKDLTKNNDLLYIIRLIIYTIHMPIFFTISGFLFQKNLDKYLQNGKIDYVKSKFKTFMIPYTFISFLDYFILLFSFKFSSLKEVLLKNDFFIPNIQEFIIMLTTFIGHFDNHLWFLYTMFIILFINIIFFKNSNFKYYLIIGLILYIFGVYFLKYIPEIVWKVLKYNFIFLFGRRLATIKNDKRINYFSVILFITSLFLIIIFCRSSQFVLNPIKLILELTSSYVIIFMVSKLFEKSRILYFLGQNSVSLTIYLFHMPFILPFIVYILTKIKISPYLISFVATIISILICVLIYNFIIKKSKILRNIILGKREGKIYKV